MSTKPSRLGPYAIGEVAQRRGLTTTYRASHEALGRSALVKTLDASVLLPSPFAADLDREARLLAGLSHESIARLLEA